MNKGLINSWNTFILNTCSLNENPYNWPNSAFREKKGPQKDQVNELSMKFLISMSGENSHRSGDSNLCPLKSLLQMRWSLNDELWTNFDPISKDTHCFSFEIKQLSLIFALILSRKKMLSLNWIYKLSSVLSIIRINLPESFKYRKTFDSFAFEKCSLHKNCSHRSIFNAKSDSTSEQLKIFDVDHHLDWWDTLPIHLLECCVQNTQMFRYYFLSSPINCTYRHCLHSFIRHLLWISF